jgi:hypothetical protein
MMTLTLECGTYHDADQGLLYVVFLVCHVVTTVN